MNPLHLFGTLIKLLISIYFILLGIFCFLFPWFPELSFAVVEFVLRNSIAISLFGFGFFTIGAAILANVILSSRQRHYRIRSGSGSIQVEERLLEQYVDKYWNDLFPEHEIPSQIQVKNNLIHLHADLPYLPIEEQRPLLLRVEKDLAAIFAKILGYEQDFTLTASFEPSRKS